MTNQNVCLFPAVVKNSRKRAKGKLRGAIKAELFSQMLAAARLLWPLSSPTR